MKKLIVALLFLSAALAGCSSGKSIPYQSKWKAHTLFYDQSPADEIDMRSRLKFGIRNNEEKLFASIATREPELISRIISSGVRLSVHPQGNKRISTKVLFPVVLKQDRRAIRKMDQVDLLGPSMQLLLDTFNKEAILNRGGSGDRFVNLLNNQDDLYCKINMTLDGELSIDYALPLKDINPDAQPTLSLSLSIEGASQSGFAPGVSIGMGAGGFGGMGMGGVSVGTGGRNAYGNQRLDLNIQVQLARSAN